MIWIILLALTPYCFYAVSGPGDNRHRTVWKVVLGLVGVMALLLLGGVLGHLSDVPARLQGLCLLLFGSAQLAGLFFRWDNARRRRQ